MSYFEGSDFVPALDLKRLTKQHDRVKAVMASGRWLTLSEIEAVTGDPAASISAQIRHLRKARFGGHTIEKRRRGDRENGLFEYRIVANEPQLELF